MCKRLFFLIWLVLVSGLTAGSANAELVGHWKFDGDANDSSGNGNHGRLMGEPNYAPGKFGQAINLNGNGDCVVIENEQNFDFKGPITISVWVKVNSPPPAWVWQDVVVKGDIENNGWGLTKNTFLGDGAYFAWYGLDRGSLSSANTNDGKWHHIAGVYDGSKMCVYVDGRQYNLVGVSGELATNDKKVSIGGNAQLPGREMDALIDDVRIYNHALSSAEIAKIAGVADTAGAESQSFADVLVAHSPNPADKAKDVSADIVLSWTAGGDVLLHEVYFGAGYSDVNDAGTSDTTGIYRGAELIYSTSYDPAELLKQGKTYYWRIDEVAKCRRKGNVWSFTVGQE